jgi:hypothetical protein
VENQPPPQLDYFSPQEPDRRRARGTVSASLVLLASWLPYLCGIVNASTVAQSYVPEITRAHLNATIVMFAAGLLLSALSLAWFARMRHLVGVIAATGVFAMQALVVICIGLAR